MGITIFWCFEKRRKSARMLADCRELNKRMTIKRTLTEDVLSIVSFRSQFKFFNTLDLRGAYCHMTIRPQDRAYFTFMTPIGQLQLTRAPQGWHNSVHHMQSGMLQLFADMPESKIFIDDVSGGAHTLEDSTGSCLSLQKQVSAIKRKKMLHCPHQRQSPGVYRLTQLG